MENAEFLKFFINEDLYHVEEVKPFSDTIEAIATETTRDSNPAGKEAPKVEEPQETIAPPPPPVFKGGNNKGILVLVEDAEAEFLNQKDLDYLLKILGAVKLSLDDIALVNTSKETGYARISFKQAWVFTTNHTFQLNNAQKYTLLQAPGHQAVLADPLTDIAASVELRKALWGILKEAFAV